MTKINQFFGAVLVLLVIAAGIWGIWSVWEPNKQLGIISISVRNSLEITPRNRDALANTGLQGILKSHMNLSPELQKWAVSFDKGDVSNNPQIGELITQSDLSAIECLQAGAACAGKHQIPEAEIWISAGAKRAKIQLADTDRDDETVHPLIVVLGRAQDMLASDHSAGPILEELNQIIMRFDRANEWDQTPEWAQLHFGEAVMMEGRYVDAQKLTDAMNQDAKSNNHWTTQQKQELRSMTARIPFKPSAKTPRDVIVAHVPVPHKLLEWADNWQNSSSHDPSDANPALIQIATNGISRSIRDGGLNALECLRISRMLSDANDPYAAEAFAAIGADCATAELVSASHNDSSALPVIYALEKAEDPLWEAPGNPLERGATLEKITAQLMRFDREQNWDQRVEWARIGHGEALYMEQRYSESLAEASQLAEAVKSDKHFTDDEKVGVEWLEALNLYETKRYQEAIPHLEKTANYKSFHHSKDAWPLWAISLAKTGYKVQADRVFDEWIHNDNPPIETAARALGIMQGQDETRIAIRQTN